MAHVSPHPFNDLAIQFVGELCKCTIDAPTEEAHREALQAFCNALIPWVDPAEVPHTPHALVPWGKITTEIIMGSPGSY
jgi:hypothetical protein